MRDNPAKSLILKSSSDHMTRKRSAISQNIQCVCIFYIMSWAISPPLAFGEIYRWVAVICALFFLPKFLSVLWGSNLFDAILCAVYILITALINYHFHAMDGITKNIQTYLFLFFYLIYISYSKSDFDKTKFVFLPLLALLSIWNFLTFTAYAEQADISRQLVRNFSGAETYMNQGIGGFGLVYTQIILIPIVLHLIQYKVFKNKLLNVFLLFYLASVVWLILNAGYSLAVINFLFTTTIYLFSNKRKIRVLLFSLLALGIILFFSSLPILEFLLGWVKHQEYIEKIRDIYSWRTNFVLVGSVESRWEFYWQSLELFLKSPLWGQLSNAEIGNHSAILDNFAQYGLLGGLIFIRILFRAPLIYLKKSNDHRFKLALSVLVSLLISSLTNSIVGPMGITLFLMYPIIWHQLEKRSGEAV